VSASRSVVRRTIALHLVAISIAAILMPLALYMMLQRAADDLHERALREQATEIIHLIYRAPDGKLQIRLSPRLEDLYSPDYARYSYSVGEADGRVLLTSFPDKQWITRTPPPMDQVVPFSGWYDGIHIFGISMPFEIGGQKLWIQVSQDLAHRDVLIDDIVNDFFSRVGWVTAPIFLLLLAIDVVIIRRTIRPIVGASALAERIGPSSTDLRLPEARMPLEVLPLIRAVNQALDRLEEGFRGQRAFTADAAHELRTPLAILTTQIDMIRDRDLAQSLRADVENMTRLVNQLLEIAELETVVIGPDETADLVAVSTEIAAFLAPLALSRNRTVAVSGAPGPVLVHGNADTIGRAVRNLVENALAHTPTETAAEISVEADGVLRVSDSGPGVPLGDRERIFRRFWRRDRQRPGSAGLGLAIVAEIARMHGATVSVGDSPEGGAVFALKFPEVIPTPREAQQELLAAK
jgi:signal transduction histidine kinase